MPSRSRKLNRFRSGLRPLWCLRRFIQVKAYNLVSRCSSRWQRKDRRMSTKITKVRRIAIMEKKGTARANCHLRGIVIKTCYPSTINLTAKSVIMKWRNPSTTSSKLSWHKSQQPLHWQPHCISRTKIMSRTCPRSTPNNDISTTVAAVKTIAAAVAAAAVAAARSSERLRTSSSTGRTTPWAPCLSNSH